MRTVKFKNITIKNRNKILITVILSLFLIYIIFENTSHFITFNMKDYIIESVKKENTMLIKNAFLKSRTENKNEVELINVIKNNKDEIIEVEFNVDECTKSLYRVMDNMNASLTDYNYTGYKLDIPLGYLTNNPFLMNLGPKIPIKIELGDTALGNITTNVEPFGINNAKVEIFLEIYLNTSILYPFETFREVTTYKALLSSKIINGVVPNYYNGLISSSETISLPLE